MVCVAIRPDVRVVDGEIISRNGASQTGMCSFANRSSPVVGSTAKKFVQQITSAPADVTASPKQPDLENIEESGTWIALKLLKGNILNFTVQTDEDPRKVTLGYLAHEVRTFDACVSARCRIAGDHTSNGFEHIHTNRS
jgi:hypothetical protein